MRHFTLCFFVLVLQSLLVLAAPNHLPTHRSKYHHPIRRARLSNRATSKAVTNVIEKAVDFAREPTEKATSYLMTSKPVLWSMFRAQDVAKGAKSAKIAVTEFGAMAGERLKNTKITGSKSGGARLFDEGERLFD